MFEAKNQDQDQDQTTAQATDQNATQLHLSKMQYLCTNAGAHAHADVTY